jgi:uncharacterized protein (TIGR01777 family)
MRVLVTGSTGLLGSALVPSLTRDGHDVVRLAHSAQPKPEKVIAWDPEAGVLNAATLEGMDAVVHLAGENIAAGRWTAERKRRILESRVKGTKLLADSLARLARPPRCLISASAIGYYGNRGQEILREDSPAGTGFLPQVCTGWERAAQAVTAGGIRLVTLRIGIVLSSRGGALARMLLPFRLGLGGRIGSGRQYMSWIDLDDLVQVFRHGIATDSLRGPVNAVAPNPVTNREFTHALGRVLSRPAFFVMPAFAARITLGEMAEELLLAGARVLPGALLDSEFRFQYPHIDAALAHALGR